MVWPGGKDGAGVYQRLINQIPPHDVFISPFLGDCAVMRRKLPAAVSIGIDRDRENIERWAANQPIGGVRLYCCCGIEWLRHTFDLYLVGSQVLAAENGGPVPRRFIYADPPYLMESRRSRRQLYAHEMTDDQHAELLDVALRLAGNPSGIPVQVMISHYPHPLYAKALRDWRSFTFDAQTRGGSRAREQVWCNYDEPAELHDARYVGDDKRQRERVRRRVKNWVNGLDRMLPDERQAVLDAIASRHIQRLPASPPKSATDSNGLPTHGPRC
jgi:DNA adenine methylase